MKLSDRIERACLMTSNLLLGARAAGRSDNAPKSPSKERLNLTAKALWSASDSPKSSALKDCDCVRLVETAANAVSA